MILKKKRSTCLFFVCRGLSLFIDETGQINVSIEEIASIEAGENKVVLSAVSQADSEINSEEKSKEKSKEKSEEKSQEKKSHDKNREVAQDDLGEYLELDVTSAIEALEKLKKGSKPFIKKLYEIADRIPEEDNEEFLSLWKSYAVYLRQSKKYSDRYIAVRMEDKGIDRYFIEKVSGKNLKLV